MDRFEKVQIWIANINDRIKKLKNIEIWENSENFNQFFWDKPFIEKYES